MKVNEFLRPLNMRLLLCQIELLAKRNMHQWRVTHPESTSSFEMLDLAGYVVDLKRVFKKFTFTIDDGTGLADCTLWDDSMEPRQDGFDCGIKDLDVGDCIAVRGQLTKRGQTLEIKVQWIQLFENPEAEYMHWMESISSLYG